MHLCNHLCLEKLTSKIKKQMEDVERLCKCPMSPVKSSCTNEWLLILTVEKGGNRLVPLRKHRCSLTLARYSSISLLYVHLVGKKTRNRGVQNGFHRAVWMKRDGSSWETKGFARWKHRESGVGVDLSVPEGKVIT